MKNLWSCLLCLVIKIEREIEQGSGQTAILVNVRWVLAASCVTAIGRPTACHRTWPFHVEVREWARGNCEGRQGAQEGRHRLTAWVEAPVDGSFFRAELSWSLATWVIVGLLWAFSIGWVRLWACGCRYGRNQYTTAYFTFWSGCGRTQSDLYGSARACRY